MNRLQQLREGAGMSRADLSRRSDVSVDVIEQLEAGKIVNEAEPVMLIPGQTPVQDRAVILNHLADALNGDLIARGMSVTPDELLQAATDDDLPEVSEAYADPSEVTQPAIPVIGLNFPQPEELPAEAKSHNTAEQPDDIDAALDQLAKNAQVTASEEAARVQPEPEAVSTTPGVAATEDLSASERFAKSPQAVTTPAAPTPSPAPMMGITTAEPLVTQETAAPEMPETVAKPEMPETTPAPEIKESEPAPAPESYEPVPGPDMPGPAPAPETMQVESEAKPEPPVGDFQTEKLSGEVEDVPPVSTVSLESKANDFKVVPDENEIEPASEVTSEPAASEVQPAQSASEVEPETPVVENWPEPAPVETRPEPADSKANLGITTGDEIGEIVPEPPALPPLSPEPVPVITPLEVKETAKPVQDVKPTTVPGPENKPPVMKPYVQPEPTAAEQSRYKLPTGTVVTTIAGVGAAVIYYVWRSWRRSKAGSERVAPDFKKK